MTIHETISIDAAPERVWALAGDLGRIADWVPALEVSALLGDERWSRLACGLEVRERILEHSDADRYWIAEVIEPPPPLTAVRTVLSVLGDRMQSSVGWMGRVEASDEADAREGAGSLARILRDGLHTLRAEVEEVEHSSPRGAARRRPIAPRSRSCGEHG